MPSLEQSELRRKDMIVLRETNLGNIVKVIFPNGIQAGLSNLKNFSNSSMFGKLGINLSSPSAQIHVSSGGGESNSAPLKFTSGSLMPAPESGAVEFDGTDIFYTTDSLSRRNVTARPYANYFSTQNQTNTVIAESIFTFNNTAVSSYFVLSSNTRIYPQYSAVYNIAFSVQFNNIDSADHVGRVWLKKDGSNLANTRSDITVLKRQGGIDGHAIMSANFFEQIASGSYIELAWSASNVGLTAEYLVTGSSPATPASPSVVITLNRVD